MSAATPPVFLFAPGAGAPSSHPWMQRWKAKLATLGDAEVFDFEYMAEGRKRPDPLPKLIEAHRHALETIRKRYSRPVILIGKSMGGRVGCHLALEEKVEAVICLGYPLCGGGDPAKMRDKILLELRTPILFVQGTRDSLCPLDLLAKVQNRMSAPNELYVVEAGDHSLAVAKGQLKASGESQDDVEDRVLRAIGKFVGKHS